MGQWGKILEDTSPEIQLEINPHFELSREIVLPHVNPAPNGSVFYKVTLQNFGDLGGMINDIVIVCNNVQGLTIDPSFIIIGRDASSNGFGDSSQDGLVASATSNTVRFSIPQYYGEKYEFIYRATIDSNALVGTALITTADWSIDGVDKVVDTHTLLLDVPIYSGFISLYGPSYTLPNEYICYEISMKNDGNQVLESVDFIVELPQEIDYYQFKTGTFHIGAIDQDILSTHLIRYETVNGVTGTLGPYSTNINTTVNLNSFIPSDDGLRKLIWSLPQMGVGVKHKQAPFIKGIVKSTAPLNGSILNHLELTWVVDGSTQTVINSHTTTVYDVCVLAPIFHRVNANSPVRPGETVSFCIGAKCRQSRLHNPILAMILPAKLAYMGNVTATYTDFFTNDTSPITPPPIIIENFNGDGDTIVKFAFVGDYSYSFKQKSRVKITFDTMVKIGAQGDLSATMVLNTQQSIGFIPPATNLYQDDYNIAQDALVSTNYAQSASIDTLILFFVSATSDKKVRGLLDTMFMEEPAVGNTIEGGLVEYKLTLTNTGNADLEKIEVIDILPHVGDTGVVQTSTNRHSAFTIYPIAEVVAKILPDNENATLDIFYSTSSDPLRFGDRFNMIGNDDSWVITPPSNLGEIRSIKVATQGVKLLPNQSLEVTIKATVPVGTIPQTVAWNSFAADITYLDTAGIEKHLLAVEPEKVGIMIHSPPIGTGQIGGVVWFDTDKDGYYTPPEQGVLDVGVVLYKHDGTPLQATFTTQSMDGSLGHYLFGNLAIGQYYIKFFIETDKYQLTKQVTTQDNGSKAHPRTSVTSLIDLTISSNVRFINAGIMDKENYTIDQIIKVNNSARSMIRNVIYNKMLIGMKYEDILELIHSTP